MRVDFYQLERDGIEVVVPMLAAKALAGGVRMCIAVEGSDERARLSDALWRHARDSFLAHGAADGDSAARQPILLGAEPSRANGATLLLVADGRWREAGEGTERLLFLFRPDAVDVARARWTALDGGERHYWAQAPDGRWLEKG